MAELLLSCQGLTKAFGARPLFEGLSFGVFEGDRVGLVGPNGSGKSTLLKILAGLEATDDGTLAVRKRLRVDYVPQDPVFPDDTTPEGVLAEALADLPGEPHDDAARAGIALGRAGFTDPTQRVGTLSGGWRKRLAIARELVREPELLLMDEPTNHLDVEGILWLEEVLARSVPAFVLVSHDRYFLQNVTRRMLELAKTWPQGIFEVQGGYTEFLARKDEVLAGQASYQESIASKVRRELDWLSRKARARTRKAQARIDEAGRLVDELADLRGRAAQRNADIEFSGSGRRTKELLKLRGVSKAYGERSVIDDLTLTLSPGMRLGLLGRNGSGKSTLLRMMAGAEQPDAGEVVQAPHLQIVQFHQDRSRLDPTSTLRRALAPHGDSVVHQGRAVHVGGWARRFLFNPEQLEQPVARLSGGEQARVLIAKLMLEPADVLLLDEPTNDLDIPTLEVLEESLLEFEGALVLVTHDRYLLDRVCTQVLALDGSGGVTPYADYPQWEAAQAEAAAAAPESRREARGREPAAPKRRKLAFREQREWDGMEAAILAAESDREAAEAALHAPAIGTDAAALEAASRRLAEAAARVEALYARWAELEALLG